MGLALTLGEHVMTGYIFPRPIPGVEARKAFPASAGAGDGRIGLALFTSFRVVLMLRDMTRNGRHHFNILRSVVDLIAVQVMNYLTALQVPAELLFCDDTVFVRIATNVRKSVAGNSHQYISVGSYGSSASPIWIFAAWMNHSHAFRITSRTSSLPGLFHG